MVWIGRELVAFMAALSEKKKQTNKKQTNKQTKKSHHLKGLDVTKVLSPPLVPKGVQGTQPQNFAMKFAPYMY